MSQLTGCTCSCMLHLHGVLLCTCNYLQSSRTHACDLVYRTLPRKLVDRSTVHAGRLAILCCAANTYMSTKEDAVDGPSPQFMHCLAFTHVWHWLLQMGVHALLGHLLPAMLIMPMSPQAAAFTAQRRKLRECLPAAKPQCPYHCT